MFHVVDAETGESITPPKQYLPPGGLGGFHIDSGFAGGVNYASGNSWGFVLNFPTPEDSGAVFAISGDGSTQLWKYDTDSPILGGVAIANGVVYVQDVGGVFHAIDAQTGQVLTQVATGSAMSGPAISRGQIYLGDGYLPALLDFIGQHPPGSIVALGLPDKQGQKAPAAVAPEVMLSDLLEVVQILRDHGPGYDLSASSSEEPARIDRDGNGVATIHDLLTIVTRLRHQRAAAEPEFAFLADEEDDSWEATLDDLANDLTPPHG